MTGTLYLMRHAETLFNVQNKTQGWCDSPLTERGIEQAKAAGRELAARGVTFDHAYCSTAERAADTLEIATAEAYGAPMPYERLKDLREVGFGAFEGKDAYLEPKEGRDEFFVAFGGERLSDVVGRMNRCLGDIMSRPGHRSVLVVAHGGCAINFYASWREHSDTGLTFFSNCMTYRYDYVDGIFVCRETFAPDLSALERPDLPRQITYLGDRALGALAGGEGAATDPAPRA